MYNLAVNAANDAIKYDSEGKLELAISKYLQAFDLLMSLIRYTDNKRLKEFYADRAEQYLSRAYELQSAIKKPRLKVSAEQRLSEDEELQSKILSMIIPEKPNVSWKDIAGLHNAKQAIEDAIILPMRYPELFKGMPTWKGILLFGPPGCGKTLLAKAAAAECNATFFNVSAADIMVKWVGDSEQRIKALFETAKKNQPSIIFLDEIDALGVERTGEESAVSTRVLSQMLQMMDGILSKPEDRIVVLGATNRPWNIDSALLRRFDKRILVPLPDFHARREIFEVTISKMPNFKLADDVDLNELAKLTEGFSGDDIKKLCMAAWYIPIHELKQHNMLGVGTLRPVTRKDFLEALQTRKSSVSPDEVRLNEEWNKKYGTA
ncbi:MAG: ATP-binding protein [Nitrososphaeria archaeon]|uniref:ATP-binding protein n=1 Tax=Fervidobacterium pennivorans TaxID=93466 RepID=A0A7C4VV33_FERPE